MARGAVQHTLGRLTVIVNEGTNEIKKILKSLSQNQVKQQR